MCTLCSDCAARDLQTYSVIHRKCRFLSKFIASDNMLCQVVKDVAIDELTLLNRAVS